MNNTRKKRVVLTEKVFDQAKQLLAMGLSNKQTRDIFKFSDPTICRIKQADSWEHYKEQRLNEYARQAANKEIAAIEETTQPIENKIQDTNFDTIGVIKDLFKIVQEQSEIIKRMDNSLTWLAEHAVIQSVNTKRRFF